MKNVLAVTLLAVLTLCACSPSAMDESSSSSPILSSSSMPNSVPPASSFPGSDVNSGDENRPYYTNALDEAKYLQSDAGSGQWSRFADYVLSIDPTAYSSLIELYADEPELPITFIGEVTLDSLLEKLAGVYNNDRYVDFDENTFSVWEIESSTGYLGDTVALGLLDASEVDVDFENEYLVFSINRKILHLSIFYGAGGDSSIMPYIYEYGTLTEDYPRRPGMETEGGFTYDYENGGWIDADGHGGVDVTLDECIDGARCIFDSTFTPNTVYLYKMSHSVQPFNMGAPVSLENYVFGEYTQIELA